MLSPAEGKTVQGDEHGTGLAEQDRTGQDRQTDRQTDHQTGLTNHNDQAQDRAHMENK